MLSKNKKKTILYLIYIAIILTWSIVLYLQIERPFISQLVLNISPNLLLTSFLNSLLVLSCISIPLFLWAVFRGRAFCRNVCPLGLLQEILPSKHRTKFSHINLYIFIGIFIASFFGINLLALFDPLVIFNRTVILFVSNVFGLIFYSIPFVIIILLSLYKKRYWCRRLCPLGAFIDWLGLFKSKSIIDLNKRKTLIAIVSGLSASVLINSRNAIDAAKIPDRLLRPPGALPEEEFKDRCIRCGSCMSVCLTKTLTPTILETGISGFFTPKLVPTIAECDEYCNKCGQACPTQAITDLPLNIKRNFKIGTAKVDQSICIAWRDNSLCLMCKEFCPYLAINAIKNKDGIPSPEVIPEVCRGCGHCEKNCPVSSKAIRVYNKGAGIMI